MVYMSSSGLDWVPLLASWIRRKKVKTEDAVQVKKLFDEHFKQIYKWCYTSVNYVMEVLQVIRRGVLGIGLLFCCFGLVGFWGQPLGLNFRSP